jgi:hypothetical protein
MPANVINVLQNDKYKLHYLYNYLHSMQFEQNMTV